MGKRKSNVLLSQDGQVINETTGTNYADAIAFAKATVSGKGKVSSKDVRTFMFSDWGSKRYEFCFDAHSERTPEAYPYGYDPYFIKGHKHDTDGCSSYYHDRMYQNAYDRYHEIRRSMEVPHGDYFWRHLSLEQASEFISRYEGKAYEVTAIGEGCNVGNGYPYWIIWFKPVEEIVVETLLIGDQNA